VPELEISREFKRQMDGKGAPLAGAIARCVQRLGENPQHPGLHTHPVRGMRNPKVFEAYVDKKNRVTFHWNGDKIILRTNCNHDILKRP
jgi:hypothetical protein